MRAMKKRNRPLAPLLAMRTHHRELDERYNRTRCDTDLKYALTRFELKVERALFGLRTIMDESVEFCANHRRTGETVILPPSSAIYRNSTTYTSTQQSNLGPTLPRCNIERERREVCTA